MLLLPFRFSTKRFALSNIFLRLNSECKPTRKRTRRFVICRRQSRPATLIESGQRGGAIMAEQSFANHGKVFPPFHFFVVPVMTINLIWSLYQLKVMGFSWDGLERVLLALGLALGFLSVRAMALKVQDRVIRLEERLRYERMLPAELKPRIGEFTVDQLVALRFACDTELPALARTVLDDKVRERKAIKQMVKTWKPDYLRA